MPSLSRERLLAERFSSTPRRFSRNESIFSVNPPPRNDFFYSSFACFLLLLSEDEMLFHAASRSALQSEDFFLLLYHVHTVVKYKSDLVTPDLPHRHLPDPFINSSKDLIRYTVFFFFVLKKFFFAGSQNFHDFSLSFRYPS